MRWIDALGEACCMDRAGVGLLSAVCRRRCLAPITPQDLQIKDVPGSAGAGAIQLYYADLIDEHNCV
jgi:hypothetical protein